MTAFSRNLQLKFSALKMKGTYFKDVPAKNFYNTNFFLLLWQSDNELPLSEMQKNWGGGGHRLRFRNKARGKLPQF